MQRLAIKFLHHLRQEGLRPASRRAWHHIRRQDRPNSAALSDRLQHILTQGCPPFGPLSPAEIAPGCQWVLPPFDKGSGGHMTVFRMVQSLAAHGLPQRVVILPPHGFASPRQAANAIARDYMPLNADIGLNLAALQPCRALIATGHQTAHAVAAYRGATHKLYFVQDYEPWFFPASSESLLAESTYDLGLTGITAGSWLAEKLARDHGMETHALSFGVDHRTYHPKGRHRPGDKKRIVFYARVTTPRRLVELGLAALMHLSGQRSDFTVTLVGDGLAGLELPFPCERPGLLSEAKLAEVFRRSDLGLVLSGTNLSLMPLELAACRCGVVMNDAPNTRWLFDESMAWFAPPTLRGLTETLNSALSDDVQRASRIDVAYTLSQTCSWETEARKLARILDAL